VETNADFFRLLQDLAKAIESGDGEALADCFTGDGIYEDYFFGAKQGRQGMRDMLAHFGAGARNFRWEFFDPVCDGKRGYARYRFSYDSLQPQAAGVRVGFDGISCVELRDGRISHYREVFDRGMALAQQNFAPDHIARLAGKYAARLRESPEWAPHFDSGIVS
jgi:hypothetical protein